jgi:SAM-dependent methyltransferase
VSDKQEFYDQKYASQHLQIPSYFHLQFHYILSIIGCSEPNITILDLGGGTGEYSLAIQNLGYNVTLFDFSAIAVEKAREIGVKKIICADFKTYDFSSQFFDIALVKGFSLLNTDNQADFRQYLQKIMALLTPKGACIYWALTDLSGAWTNGGWYHPTKADLERNFDQAILFPAFRYGARLPHLFNRLVSYIFMNWIRPHRPMTVVAIKSNS